MRFDRYGGPEVLELHEVPTPDPGPGEVLVEVRAAGVNPVDWKVRKGFRSSGALEAPRGLGSDAAGVVAGIGEGVDGVTVGDEVVVRGADGAYASHVVVTPAQLAPKPATLSWEEAAGLGVPAGTAHQVLTSLGLAEGETLLVHGGSGGVGQAAIQLARAKGAAVVATASAVNLERLRELGALAVEHGPGLVERIRTAAPDGIDRVLDAAGTDEAIEASLALVPDRSRIATIVRVEEAEAFGIRAWSGSRAGRLSDDERRLRAEAIGVISALAAEGRYEVEIAASYPLERIGDAHAHSESGHVRGKIVVIP
ncbi:NADP-dependent oxidoreductase [Agromyces intestinalis]|uniref:NADP-dependent oxidoreductase n=1 Tax=Agromyces intestinalis TaxID=2592652 RepID=UPI001FE4B66E|nr:NADP-dependent oxidoreductase [Agromyces intestinalis]